ncbi:MAG TPA: DUF1761 domain-containing protein [Hyphomicrobiaceae bacterium]|nr:DUF1761 domain-containing protein [Hyphomicrobiaceae bacterium]
MTFAGMTYWAVLVAAIASFLFGGLWYGIFGSVWLRAANLPESEGKRPGRNALPFIVAFVAQLLMAYILAGTIGHLGAVTARSGVITGAFVWLGFVITSLVVNHAFQGARPLLTLIDGGHWLGVLLIQGAIIGAIGVR